MSTKTGSHVPARGGSGASALAAAAAFASQVDGSDGNAVRTDNEDDTEAMDQLDMEGRAMTDEELARVLAGHEMVQAGRRRETRRSWNASLSVIKPAAAAKIDPKASKGKKLVAPKFGAADFDSAAAPTDAEIDAMVESSVGIRRNIGRAMIVIVLAQQRRSLLQNRNLMQDVTLQYFLKDFVSTEGIIGATLPVVGAMLDSGKRRLTAAVQMRSQIQR